MSLYVEAISVAFGIAYVILAARGSIWCWPMGIIASALGVILFLEARIYAEAFLFSYYIIMGFYGWYDWKQQKGLGDDLPIATWRLNTHLLIFGCGLCLTLLVAWFLDRFTDAVMPLLDSFTTVFSFIATWMVAKRILENWVYWIAIDCLTIYLYLSRDLKLYAFLSLVYTVLAIYGYAKWRRNYFQNQTANGID